MTDCNLQLVFSKLKAFELHAIYGLKITKCTLYMLERIAFSIQMNLLVYIIHIRDCILRHRRHVC